MKPSEMSNEELAHSLECSRAFSIDEDLMYEAAARLRNSIPKPVVPSVTGVIRISSVTDLGSTLTIDLDNSEEVYRWIDMARRMPPTTPVRITPEPKPTALGINDTEGGV